MSEYSVLSLSLPFFLLLPLCDNQVVAKEGCETCR